eukprot:2035484-Pyramimonas_sp.AAC.1
MVPLLPGPHPGNIMTRPSKANTTRGPQTHEAPNKMEHLTWRRAQPYAVVNTVVVRIAMSGSPYGATKRVKSLPKWGGGAMRALL